MNQDTITLVAKGPSAVNALRFIEDCRTDVAVVNDAGNLVPGLPIKYAFFSDSDRPHLIRSFLERTETLVSPRNKAEVIRRSTIDHPYVTYRDHECCGDLESLIRRIAEGGICHHHTTPGAIHWLAKHCRYRKIRVIGVDGGRVYAEGTFVDKAQQRSLRMKEGFDYLDKWKHITKIVAGLVSRVYAVEIEWYAVHNSR